MKKNDKEVDLQKVAEYRDFRRKHPKLRFLFFELTDSCNLNCLHCGSNCQSSNIQFLDFNLIKKTLDEVADAFKLIERKEFFNKILITQEGYEPGK